jgi:hypothetical protein
MYTHPRNWTLALFSVLLLALALLQPAAAQEESAASREATLIEEMTRVAAEELSRGQTASTEHGRVLVGESAHRVEALHREAARLHDAQIARPAAERMRAEAAVRAFLSEDNGSVEYRGTASSSYSNQLAEFYMVGDYYVEVDRHTNRILQVGPRSDRAPLQSQRLSGAPLSVRALQERATQIGTRYSEVDLSTLSLHVGNKGSSYFFRWEESSKPAEGLAPFLQVGLDRTGALLSYTNVLGYNMVAPSPISGQEPQARAMSVAGVYIFANNGNYYREYGPSNYWYTATGRGYCGNFGSCSPNQMRFTYNGCTLTNYAVWDNPDYNQWGTHAVFIPSVNATAYTSYTLTYNTASSYSFHIAQTNYYNQWVPTTPNDPSWYGIRNTWVNDNSCYGSGKVGVDEVKITY